MTSHFKLADRLLPVSTLFSLKEKQFHFMKPTVLLRMQSEDDLENLLKEIKSEIMIKPVLFHNPVYSDPKQVTKQLSRAQKLAGWKSNIRSKAVANFLDTRLLIHLEAHLYGYTSQLLRTKFL